jgi:GT2 family glycosyltransferase
MALHTLQSHTLQSDVGIVAIGRNEGERLIGCLTSASRAGAAIVYVDSGSTDGSVAAAECLGAYVVRLDLRLPFTAARARNEGFAALKGLMPQMRFVQFIDGDCELAAGWLKAALAFLEARADVAIVCGRRRERFPQRSIYNRLCDAEWDTPVGEAAFCGGDTLVRVDAFEAAGGFRGELIAGEEPELCTRLKGAGWKIWRLGDEMTLHDAAITRFGQWWLRAVRAGYGYADLARLHGAFANVYRRQLASAFVWAGVLPVAILVGAVFHPAALFGLLVYPLQIARIACKTGGSAWSWTYAFFMVLGKFAELEGVLRYWWRRWRGNKVRLIEYKSAG